MAIPKKAQILSDVGAEITIHSIKNPCGGVLFVILKKVDRMVPIVHFLTGSGGIGR